MLIYWRVLQPPSHSRVYASWSRNGICSAEFYRGLWGFGQPLKGGGVVLCNWEAQKAMFIDRKRRWCCVFSLTFIDVHLHKYVYIYIYILIFKLGWLHVPRKPLLPLPLRWTQWQKHPQGCAFFRWCIGHSDRRPGPSGDNSEIPPFPVVLFIFEWKKNLVLLTFLGNFYWNINSVIFENGFYSYLTCFSCLKFAAHLNDYSTIFCATKVSLRAITTF